MPPLFRGFAAFRAEKAMPFRQTSNKYLEATPHII